MFLPELDISFSRVELILHTFFQWGILRLGQFALGIFGEALWPQSTQC